MKARSCALEVFVLMSREELYTLEKVDLTGILDFEDYFSEPHIRRDILFTLKHDPNQREFLHVDHRPEKEYFGKADQIDFTINNEYYQELVKYGEFVDRFFVGGKLQIRVEGHGNS